MSSESRSDIHYLVYLPVEHSMTLFISSLINSPALSDSYKHSNTYYTTETQLSHASVILRSIYSQNITLLVLEHQNFVQAQYKKLLLTIHEQITCMQQQSSAWLSTNIHKSFSTGNFYAFPKLYRKSQTTSSHLLVHSLNHEKSIYCILLALFIVAHSSMNKGALLCCTHTFWPSCVHWLACSIYCVLLHMDMMLLLSAKTLKCAKTAKKAKNDNIWRP